MPRCKYLQILAYEEVGTDILFTSHAALLAADYSIVCEYEVSPESSFSTKNECRVTSLARA